MAKKREIEEEINKLPQISDEHDPHAILIQLCGKYIREIKEYIDGNLTRPEYYENLRPFLTTFKELINTTKPKFDTGGGGSGSSHMDSTDSQALGGITVGEVRQLIEEKRLKELPGLVPQNVYNGLISGFAKEWEKICLQWFVGFRKYALEFITKICRRHFKEYTKTGLYGQAK